MIDFILEVDYEATLDDEVQGLLYLTAAAGSTLAEGGPRLTLTAYFESPGERDAAAVLLAPLVLEVRKAEHERLDWLDLYQQSLEPMVIGKRFIVAPDVKLIPPESDRLPIVIPQEQAFGTGSHETTALCIELLEGIDVHGARCLDIGSGSGILAIAMRRLDAAHVIAFDNDLDALASLRLNPIRNGVGIAAFIGALDALGAAPTSPRRAVAVEATAAPSAGEDAGAPRFDVITMNILPEVIMALLPQVVSLLRGALVVSGVLVERRDDVLAAAEAHGLERACERSRGEWWAAEFRLRR